MAHLGDSDETPGFSLAQPCQCSHLESDPAKERFLSLPLSVLTAFQINKFKKKEKKKKTERRERKRKGKLVLTFLLEGIHTA